MDVDALDKLREALADAIKRRWVLRGDARALDFADELLPTMQAHIAARVATELRYAARMVHTSTDDEGYRWMMQRADEWDAS